MQIKSNATVEANKLASVYSVCNTQFDINHSGIITVTKDILGGSVKSLTIEPGKYRVIFNTVYSVTSWQSIHIDYYTKSGKRIEVHNTANGITGVSLETVTHEVDLTDIGNYDNDTNSPFTVWVYLGSYREGGTIIFEAID